MPAAKRFIYRMEKLLELKQQKEDEEKKKLKQLLDLEIHERQVKAQLETTLANAHDELKTKRLSGRLNIEELRFFPLHIKSLEAKIKQQELKLQEIAIKIVQQREALLKATQERQAYEKHKEKCREEWQFEVDQEEARLLDELATLKFARDASKRAEE